LTASPFNLSPPLPLSCSIQLAKDKSRLRPTPQQPNAAPSQPQ
jgi:hypothetical protein